MAIPAILAAAALAKTAGSLAGGIGQYNDTQRGMNAYKNLANQGVNTMQQGKQESNAAFDPYTQAGQTGVAGATNAAGSYLQNTMAGQPNLADTKTTAQGTQAYLDPSANYSTDQANRAMQASALAKGGVGGGLARALSNNASKMAMTNWNNAASQQLAANQQNYGQANQNWQNNFQAQNQNMANYQNLANMGLSATGTNQGLQQQYNSGINQNYLSQAGAMQGGWNTKGQIFNNTATAFGNNIGGGISSVGGAAAGAK
jgi:hypothetical protein